MLRFFALPEMARQHVLPFVLAFALALLVGALLGGGGILTVLEAGDAAASVRAARGGGGGLAAHLSALVRSPLDESEAAESADVEPDDEPGASGGAAALPRWIAPPARLVQLRDDPVARRAFWFDCLDSVEDAECRPGPRAAAGAPLAFHAWKQHVRNVLAATAPFRGLAPHTYRHAKFNSSAYDGPWIENKWIDAFLGGSAWESMYPLVPLFVQWTDALHGGDGALFDQAVAALLGDGGPLRDDTLYVTVMQLDRAPKARHIPCARLRNVVVLGAGGWGNVALPLLKGETVRMNYNLWPPDKDPVHNWARKSVLNVIVDTSKFQRDGITGPVVAALGSAGHVNMWPFDIWQWVTHSSIFIGSMWGPDRATFRLYENIRYGRATLHIYKDEPWLPYQHNYDFRPPGAAGARLGAGGVRDVSRFGAQLQTADGGAPTGGEAAPEAAAMDPALWEDAVDGGVWGPGGYGFAVHQDELPAFFCLACEFLKPDSAARWRHVRALPLHRYGPTKLCPCTPAGWTATLAALGSTKNYTVPRGSVVYEMERRAMTSADRYFSYAGIVKHLDALFVDPGAAALKCVPRPATVQPTRVPLPAAAA